MGKQFIYGVYVTSKRLETNKFICFNVNQVRNIRRNIDYVERFEVYKLTDYFVINKFLNTMYLEDFEPALINLWSEVSRNSYFEEEAF